MSDVLKSDIEILNKWLEVQIRAAISESTKEKTDEGVSYMLGMKDAFQSVKNLIRKNTEPILVIGNEKKIPTQEETVHKI